MKKVFLLLLLCLNSYSLDLLKSKEFKKITFSKIPQTQYEYTKEGALKVVVDKSNAPMIYPFDKKLIKGIRFKIKTSALLKLNSKEQGSKEADDFLFKVGLITPGSSSLSFFQRTIAPAWVVELDKLSKAQGVDKILFFNLVQDKTLVGKKRVHPLSELMVEKMEWHLNKTGSFHVFEKIFDTPIYAIGAWISPDGDQTSSSYELEIPIFELIE